MSQFCSSRLKKHTGIWRLDGVGQLISNKRIEIHFSGISKEGLDSPYKGKSRNGRHLPFIIHPANLFHFKVGTLWEDGKKIKDSSSNIKKFEVDINALEWVRLKEFIKLKNNISINSILPGYFYKIGENRRKLAKTFYAKIPVKNNEKTNWLIIPASEVLRFYIGTSTSLIPAAINGNFDNFINWNSSERNKQAPVLYVNKVLSSNEKAVFLRALSSKIAYNSLYTTHNYLKQTSIKNKTTTNSNQKPFVIKPSFPFQGITTLIVTGKAIDLAYNTNDNNNNYTEWAFFGMEIQKCLHSFKFSDATILGELAKKPVTVNSEDGTYEDGTENTDITKPHIDDPTDEVGDGDADARLKRLSETVEEDRFPDFNSVSLNYDRKGNTVGKTVKKQGQVPTNKKTHADGTYGNEGKGTRGTDSKSQVNTDEPSRNITDFILMLSALRILSAEKKWKIITRKLDGYTLFENEFITYFPKIKNRRKSWHYIEPENKKIRQMVWVELLLTVEGKRIFIYLAEMQLREKEKRNQRTLIFYNNDFTLIDNTTFNNILQLTIDKRRWYSSNYEYSNEEYKNLSEKISTSITFSPVTHPHNKKNNKEDNVNDKYLLHWAKKLYKNLNKIDY